ALRDPVQPAPRSPQVRLAARPVGGRRRRGLPDDRHVPVRPGADLPAGRPAVHALPRTLLGARRGGGEGPRGRPGDGLPALPGGRHGGVPAHPQHRRPRALLRTGRRRPAPAHDRRGGADRDRRGVRRGDPALRARRGGPLVRQRQGGDGPRAPAAPVGQARAPL
ncbi:MAG: DUF1794, partial [uncultured Nocardioidaceae bacterium]